MQISVKKRLVYGGIVFIWIFMPAHLITIGVLSTDIVNGRCVPWGAYSSYAAEKTMVFSIFFFTYLLPLMAMIFCYCRIVYSITHKVTLILS